MRSARPRPLLLLASLSATGACGVDLPTAPDPDTRFVEVSAGDDHTCAVAEDGEVWCWGLSLFARLGTAESEACVNLVCPVPVSVGEGGGLHGIEAGGMHNCAVRDLRAFCWGFDWRGQLGSGGTTAQECGSRPNQPEALPCSSVPQPVALGFPTAQVAAGTRHSCALATDGRGWCWGYDVAGQLGDEAQHDSVDVPVAVAGDHRFVDITAGTSHTCAIDDDEQAWCWGTDLDGRLGLGEIRSSAVPAPVVGEYGSPDPSRHDRLYWADVDAGTAHNCGLTTDGLVLCWGLGGHGRLGEGTTNYWWFPVRARLPARAIDVTAGDSHSCAILWDGSAWCWGRNQHGQLGNASTEDALTPVRVESDQTFVAITAGGRHTCALTDQGALYCWGAGDAGQLGTGDLSDRTTPQPLL